MADPNTPMSTAPSPLASALDAAVAVWTRTARQLLEDALSTAGDGAVRIEQRWPRGIPVVELLRGEQHLAVLLAPALAPAGPGTWVEQLTAPEPTVDEPRVWFEAPAGTWWQDWQTRREVQELPGGVRLAWREIAERGTVVSDPVRASTVPVLQRLLALHGVEGTVHPMPPSCTDGSWVSIDLAWVAYAMLPKADRARLAELHPTEQVQWTRVTTSRVQAGRYFNPEATAKVRELVAELVAAGHPLELRETPVPAWPCQRVGCSNLTPTPRPGGFCPACDTAREQAARAEQHRVWEEKQQAEATQRRAALAAKKAKAKRGPTGKPPLRPGSYPGAKTPTKPPVKTPARSTKVPAARGVKPTSKPASKPTSKPTSKPVRRAATAAPVTPAPIFSVTLGAWNSATPAARADLQACTPWTLAGRGPNRKYFSAPVTDPGRVRAVAAAHKVALGTVAVKPPSSPTTAPSTSPAAPPAAPADSPRPVLPSGLGQVVLSVSREVWDGLDPARRAQLAHPVGERQPLVWRDLGAIVEAGPVARDGAVHTAVAALLPVHQLGVESLDREVYLELPGPALRKLPLKVRQRLSAPMPHHTLRWQDRGDVFRTGPVIRGSELHQAVARIAAKRGLALDAVDVTTADVSTTPPAAPATGEGEGAAA